MTDEEREPQETVNRDCKGTRSHKRCDPQFCSLAGTDKSECDGYMTGIHVKGCPAGGFRGGERRPRDPFGLAAYSQEDKDEAARVIERLLGRR